MKPILCTVRDCKRRDAEGKRIPFGSYGALGSHRRRSHGLAALGTRSGRQKSGGLFPCGEPGCPEPPYMTRCGLGSHKRRKHGIESDEPGSQAKADYRRRRNSSEATPQPLWPSDPPPRSNGFEPHVPRDLKNARIDPGRRELLRLRLLYMINGPWARELDLAPSMVRDLVAELLASNFALPRFKQHRVATINAYASR